MQRNLAVETTTQPADRAAPKGAVIDRTFKATFRWVRRVIHETMDALENEGLNDEEKGSVEIVLAEALNNIVKHAYPQDAPGDIRLSLRRRGSGLMVEISDRGRPMPNGRAPIGNHPSSVLGEDSMPEGGFGWFLIREIVRDLIYDRRDDANFLIFRLAIGESRPPDRSGGLD